MREEVILIFQDGSKFVWRTWKLGDARKAIKMQKKHGNPIDIIGTGKVANLLREKYKIYNKNPKSYKPNVFGTASQLSGMTKEDLQSKFDSVKRKLHLKK